MVSACTLKPSTVPLPESEFILPITKPLNLSGAKPFVFIEISQDSIVPPKVKKLNLDKLPNIPFTINDFKPFDSPLQSTKFDWDILKDSLLNLDRIPDLPLDWQKSLMPKPQTIRTGPSKLMSNTSSGIMQFSEEEGLPGSQITGMAEDKNGNVWIATDKGPCRLEGEIMHIYSGILNKAPEGSDYKIADLLLDRKGNLWILTLGDGVYMLDLTLGLIYHTTRVRFGANLYEDYSGKIWISGWGDGVFIIDPINKTLKNIRPDAGTSQNNTVSYITGDKQKNIWLSYIDHLMVIDSIRHSYKTISAHDGLPNLPYFEIYADHNGDIWLGGFRKVKGTDFISFKNKSIYTIHADQGMPGQALKFIEDAQNRIWVLRNDTSYIINKERTEFKKILIDIKFREQYKGSVLLDKNDNLWIGSVDKGIIQIDTKGPMPEHLSVKNGLIDNNIWSVWQDHKDRVWIGTYKGINIFNPYKNQLSILGKDQGLDGGAVRKINGDDLGNVFISSNTAFSIINPNKNQVSVFTNFYNRNFELVKSSQDSPATYWINLENGISFFDMNTYAVKKLDKSNGLLSDVIWDLVADHQGNIWAGSDSGLMIIHPKSSTIQYFTEKEGLANNAVMKLMTDKNGDIWIATQKGISIINPLSHTITNLTAKEGLIPETIYDLAESNEVLYAGSTDGLILIKKPDSLQANSNWTFSNYNKRQGFAYNDYNQNVGTTLRNGQTWWGIAPVLTVLTQSPQPDTSKPKVFITAINIMDQFQSFKKSNKELASYLEVNDTVLDETKKIIYTKTTLPKDSNYLQDNNIRWDSLTSIYDMPIGLTLPHDQNYLHFSFVNIDIKAGENLAFRYILEGKEDQWSKPNRRNQSKNYYNLSPGSYTFRVIAKGFNGLWSEPAALSFTIRPPWYLTWWAYLLYFISAAFIITAYASYRSRKLHGENVDLEMKIKHRTQELTKSLEELKTAQNQLIQSEKMASLGELTAGIAHEIQNPLNFVNNFSEVSIELAAELKDEIQSLTIAPQQKENLDILITDLVQNQEKINVHGKRADSIVKSMLHHSRNSGSNTGLAVKEPTDINALADEYLRLSYHGLRAKDKTFNAIMHTDFDHSLENVMVIPQDIGRVILNLFTNAFYAVTEKKKLHLEHYEPTVSVTTKILHPPIAGLGIEIRVKDNGIGIPKKVISKIFQPFFTTKPTGQGTGLGLSMSYDIVTKGHGGTIEINSTEGEGSEFIIRLPYIREGKI